MVIKYLMQKFINGISISKTINIMIFTLAPAFICTAQLVTSNTYLLKNKLTHNAMTVYGGSNLPGTAVLLNDFNLTNSQNFTFKDLGGGIYNIYTNSKLLVSLKYQILATTGGTGSPSGPVGFVGNWVLSQEMPYGNGGVITHAAVNSVSPKHQQWKITDLGNNNYTIESIAFPGKILQPFDINTQTGIVLADKSNSDIQTWIITPPRKRPDQATANIGYGPLIINLGDGTPWYVPDRFVDFDEGDISITDAKADVDHICPQHRSIGETSAMDKPITSYEILEGVVQRNEAGIAGNDFFTSHYTHDYCFKVKPDPEFDYLLGARYSSQYPNTTAGNECKNLEQQLTTEENLLQHVSGEAAKKTIEDKILALNQQISDCRKTKVIIPDNYQSIMEVEWESGLAEDGASDNPAVPFNIKGTSFGFSTAKHTLGEEIWNWPTVDDRVHVEGIWIWDRGHDAPTEIHPPHFVAVQRSLPVSFIIGNNGLPVIRNQPDDKFIATRVDVFASADGSAMWNNKGLQTFAQTVDMKRKDYTFYIKHPFSKPPSSRLTNVSLQCKFLKQKADDFPSDPIIKIDNGIVSVTVPWKSANVSNNSIFARTFLVYWETSAQTINASSTKVLDSEKPHLYQIDIIKVDLAKQLDGDPGGSDEKNPGNHGYGDFRIFCNVGSDWIFLNEFDPTVNKENILQSGLGRAMNVKSFQINKSFKVYVKDNNNNALRIAADGWEADGLNYLMGHIYNEYSRDAEPAAKWFGSALLFIYDTGEADDGIGNIDKMFTPYDIDHLSLPALSRIPKVLQAMDGNNHIFDITYQIKEIPYSTTYTPPAVLEH
jgi:hypothetical protein